MNPQQQRFEIESVRTGDNDLAVKNASLRQRRGERLEQLGKIAIHRLLVAALQQKLRAVAKYERAKPVPLRLKLPAIAFRQSIGRGGQHWRERWFERQTYCHQESRSAQAFSSRRSCSR